MKGALKMYEMNGSDISELLSQPRVTQEAAPRSYDGVRLVPGWSLDLTREDPLTGKPWDLAQHAVRERVRKMVRDTAPFLIIGSPPCTMFSSLQKLSKKRRDKAKFNKDVIMKELCDIKAEYPCGTQLTTHIVNFKNTMNKPSQAPSL